MKMFTCMLTRLMAWLKKTRITSWLEKSITTWSNGVRIQNDTPPLLVYKPRGYNNINKDYLLYVF